MTELSREILDSWQIRKKYAQKTAFIDFLQSHLPEAKVEQKGKNRNIVLGDPDSAKLVLTAHYDTCAVMPIPNFLTPKNILVYIIYQLLMVAVFFAVAFAVGAGVFALTDSFDLARFAGLVVYFALLFALMKGPANKHTANDNTSGIITVLEVWQSLTEAERERVCVVLFDNEESGLVGSTRFNKLHKAVMKDKLLVNFDCVSDGDYLMLVIKKKAEKAHGDLLRSTFRGSPDKQMLFEKSSTTIYPSDQANFPLGVAVSAFNKAPVIGYYMDKIHTPKDTVFDERNITLLRDNALRLCRNI